MKRFAYYPGCSLHSTGAEYDLSLKATSSKLDIVLDEVKDWVCCGSSAAHPTNFSLSVSLPIYNLNKVEKEGKNEVIVPCAACFSRFKIALHEISNSSKTNEKVSKIIGSEFNNSVKVIHPLEIFENGNIKKNIKKDLSKLKVVCYYGCLLTRPSKIMQFDEPEYPMSMDRILTSAGINALDWGYKTDCCGASFSLTRVDIVLELTKNILEDAKQNGASAIAVACPLCHANLDTRQNEVNKKYNTDYNLPVFYFTQLIGLAFGIGADELGLNKHLVDPMPVLEVIK